jgi:molybdopterin biosynthesis enzyme
LPATVCWTADGPQLTPISWRGSGDVPSLTRANAFLMAEAGRTEWKAGDLMRVLLK